MHSKRGLLTRELERAKQVLAAAALGGRDNAAAPDAVGVTDRPRLIPGVNASRGIDSMARTPFLNGGVRLATVLLLVLISTSMIDRAACGQQPDPLEKELPRVRALEPAAALASFQLHAGFSLDLIAVEPLVTDPVSACYDADGRLYVVEMRGYPYPEKSPSGHVTRLVDRDGDGRFDARTTFVDGLSWPTSVARV